MKPLQTLRLALTLMLLAPMAWAQTPFGNAIVLNGSNQYVVVTNFGNIIPTNEVTVEFWANTTVPTTQSAFILNPDSDGNRFNAHINYGTSPAQGVTYWDFGNISGGGRVGPINAPANSISNWVHYAFVASQSGNYMCIYTNGVLLATNTGMTPFVRGNYDLDIGGGSNYFSYNGSLDDFRVWNTALSQAQIQANLGVPLTGSETNLLVYYRFDNSGGTVATNSATATGALYNGVIMGGAPLVASGVLSSVVTTNADNGPGSLRQAVANAQPGTTITFTNTLSGKTILLTSGQIVLSNNITIDASALANGIAINGNGTARVFEVTNAAALLEALTITNGFGSDGGFYGGGGILNFGNLTLANCTLSGNSETGWIGGAIDAETGTVTANQCTFSGNSASGSSCFGGGAIGVYAATVTVNQSTLSDNSVNNSHNGGGGIFDSQGKLVVNQCTLSGNSANSSDAGGGGIYNNDGTLVVNQSTVAANSANNTDGGGGINDFGLGNTMLTNSIFAANTATGGQGADIFNNYVSLTFGGTNLVQAVIYNNNATINGTYLTAAANLAPLGNYGGPTPTMPPLAGSPAIDSGDDSAASQFATDQRGFPRVAGAHVDIGAVEAQTAPADNPPVLGNITLSGGGGGSGTGTFLFTFTNAPDADFTVLTSTNVALPLAIWTVLGEVMQPAPGQYEFTDPQATTNAMRFYRVISP